MTDVKAIWYDKDKNELGRSEFTWNEPVEIPWFDNDSQCPTFVQMFFMTSTDGHGSGSSATEPAGGALPGGHERSLPGS